MHSNRQLELVVVWPRHREGDAGIIDAGLEDSFFSLLETSHCCVKPQMREGMEGRLMRNERRGTNDLEGGARLEILGHSVLPH